MFDADIAKADAYAEWWQRRADYHGAHRHIALEMEHRTAAAFNLGLAEAYRDARKRMGDISTIIAEREDAEAVGIQLSTYLAEEVGCPPGRRDTLGCNTCPLGEESDLDEALGQYASCWREWARRQDR